MQKGSKRVVFNVRPLGTLVVMVGIWWSISKMGWINPLFLPSLGSVGRAFKELLTGTDIYINILATVFRALFGLLLSVMVAVPLGLVFGRFNNLYQFFELPADFFRSIPSSALFFLFILFFGLGDIAKVAVVFYGCSLIMLVNTVYGAKPSREKQDRINMLRSFGATSWQIFYLAVWRDAMPNIAAGFRVCVSLALVLVIVTEMFLSANNGLGRQIYDLYLAYRVPEMYACLIILGLVGFAANKVSLFMERKTSFWIPERR